MADVKGLPAGAKAWLANSLKHRRDEARQNARRCRAAYKSGGSMQAAAGALADAHDAAADVFQRMLEEVKRG